MRLPYLHTPPIYGAVNKLGDSSSCMVIRSLREMTDGFSQGFVLTHFTPTGYRWSPIYHHGLDLTSLQDWIVVTLVSQLERSLRRVDGDGVVENPGEAAAA